ncbi:hypothetical protein GCM10007877_23610 [Marinibactrum halimedae]|uniref:Uncharacterized protein n=1 Tax=Marinibactrum halimedae TaxID=1444977 RepID=A0AA37WMR8_9GAMM|nr:hypothetical protein GCM10007877_23610 [Marinibactrum halimedae]
MIQEREQTYLENEVLKNGKKQRNRKAKVFGFRTGVRYRTPIPKSDVFCFQINLRSN